MKSHKQLESIVYAIVMKKVILKDGWIDIAKKTLSPNFDQRPSDLNVELLVIHAISLPAGHYGTTAVEALLSLIHI